jgi:hypothetical protein
VSDKKTANLRDAIGIALIASFVGALGVLFWKDIPRSNEQLIVYMLGQLSGFVSGIVAYHYVTKAGEKELDAQRVDNTSKALDAIRAAAEAPAKPAGDQVAEAAEQVAEAAADEAETITKKGKK